MIGIRNNFVKQFTAYQTMVLSYRRYAQKNYKHCCSSGWERLSKAPFFRCARDHFLSTTAAHCRKLAQRSLQKIERTICRTELNLKEVIELF